MHSSKLLESLIKEIKEEFGEIHIEDKRDWIVWRFLGLLVHVLTLGTVNFISGTLSTTIGTHIGIPNLSTMKDCDAYAILLHERVHLRQFKRLGLGSVWLGTVIFLFLYLFIPFPIGIAYFRSKFEKEAYKETIRAYVQLNGPFQYSSTMHEYYEFRKRIVTLFTGPTYLWMWPFNMNDWFEKAYIEVLREEDKLDTRM